MVALYVKKIKKGTFTIDKVPNLWKDKVIAVFQEELDNGVITQEEFDRYTSEGTGEE